ncbi:MAG: hypothetical protein R2718_05130 [Solirubrobacterales bacterium]|nr:hypothetical protein [Solirubrobacterales bacterium]
MKGYRAHLQSAVAASAAPYGYTLTIWTSGAVATHARGIPTAWEALLFLLGAVLGFGVTAAVAYGRPTEIFASRQHGFVRLWGAFHLLSVGLAIAGVALVVEIFDSSIVWLLVGLIATTTYLMTIAAQFTLADTAGR